MDNESSFAGNGASKQSNALDGAISVTVAKRFANGNLLVRGQKWITINTGREFVRVQGIVRPSDIAPDNSVVSWKVADAYHLLRRAGHGGQRQQAGLAVPLLQFTAHAFLKVPTMLRSVRLPAAMFVMCTAWCLMAAPSHAERVKDLAQVAGRA